MLEYRNLVDDNEIVLDSCKTGNVDLSITKIYYARKDYDFNKLVEAKKLSLPSSYLSWQFNDWIGKTVM